jgi:hypothetical protein
VPVLPNKLEALLFEEESATLDFKRDQYPFDNATDEQKSELLKDILAFANAWRRSDAYILVGVEEIKGGRSKVIGVANFIDDAKLQQFVNSKTQRPVHFAAFAAKLDGLDVFVVQIPPQERPIYLTKNYGKLEKNTVYIRRSSSTDIASPDEVARMGLAVSQEGAAVPLLDVQFYDQRDIKALGYSVELTSLDLTVPDDQQLPDYGIQRLQLGPNLYTTMPIVGRNNDFYRDAARHLKTSMETSRIDFVVSNEGSVVATDVRLEITLDDPSGTIILRDAANLPSEPSPDLLNRHPKFRGLNADITVQQSRQKWIVSADLGKIQPKGSAYTSSGLFIGSKAPSDIPMVVKVYADNLPSPKTCTLSVKVETRHKTLSVDEVIQAAKRFYLEDEGE